MYLRTKKRLLLAGPENPDRDRIRKMLESEGFDVLLAETGQQALRTLRDYLVDGIVLDEATPYARYDADTGGKKTLEEITDANPFLPLVLTCPATAELDHATSLMADMVLFHPVAPAALLDAVDTVLNETLRERARRKAGDIAVLR